MKLALGVLLLLGSAVACGGDDGGSDASGAGEGGGTAGTSTAGTGAAGRDAAGSGASGEGRGASGNGASGDGAGGSSAGAGGGGAFTGQTGLCGQRAMATVGESSFMGFEEYYLIGEEGFGDDICVVRFEVTRVGEAPEGCVDPVAAEVACKWTHLVEFGNPTVVTDQGGVCSESELGFDDDRIAEIDGSQVAYGFVSEFAGHESVTMRYDDATEMWKGFANGTWDEAAGTFRFDRRDELCDY